MPEVDLIFLHYIVRTEVQAATRVPRWLPVPVPHGEVQHPLLPPQCRQPRKHLPRHPQGEVVSFIRGTNK